MIINIYDNIERIRDEWRDLQEKGQCFIFQQYEWADTISKMRLKSIITTRKIHS